MKKLTILLAIFLCALTTAQTALNRDWYLQK